MTPEERIAEFNDRYRLWIPGRESLFVKRLRDAGFDGGQIAEILGVLDGICKECWDADSSECNCTRDE